jgi:LacI family transcriptional regulator
VTIYDVAEQAGVSTATVSRVINSSSFVSKQVRQRVEDAIAELGYVPNATARNLSAGRSTSIALLISNLSNPFSAEVVEGVRSFFSEQEIGLVLGNIRADPDTELSQLDLVLAQGVGGVLIAPGSQDDLAVAEVKRRNIPCVILDARGDFELDVVRGDSYGGAVELTRLLLDLGHRRIALVNARRDNSTARDRFAGYAQAFKDAGIEVDEALVQWGPSLFYTIEFGARATEELLALPDPPTAIFAGNDFVALGVLGALTARRVQVPDEMAVVSFDGITLPFLTAVIQPAADMGRTAAAMLYERMQGYGGPPREHVVPIELRISGSSGGPLPGEPATEHRAEKGEREEARDGKEVYGTH